ncbi:peptide/nickel transport system ATP-binding protein/oligopeptide transport system ATP-binding protein [Melghirimyces profundicolus]|uniref:Peptide/nickel transport system ATP-binding protein/oligopeptide transport system ATP-binding protein n=1 Tax=Melghirimyces profundicolus TaxID=1242148 RepID=A0A2T6C7I1_9BACL|nr:dipeptide ABC transporter ATP-binding protein [Melghirimyces profundicolus]PTX64284.1 peptide/nickel transport system ATP-binding protein/oligopeptide transport system ATP-binding protein [Melghirimyces profundicolus]
MSEEKLIEVRHLSKSFPIKKGFLSRQVDWLKAVNNISFSVYEGETLALVGESGCGKSTTRKLLLNLLKADRGEVRYRGENIYDLNDSDMRRLRKKMQAVFQDPYASLNPKWKIGNIVGEPLWIHRKGTARERKERVQELLSLVGINPRFYDRYPHEFSGGQRQRIGIARALALNPEVIIADEPVSALDVSIQAQVLNMFRRLQDQLGLTYVFISHDLSVVKHISDRVGVMYLGEIVEMASTEELYNDPKHPYTKALMSSIPLPDPNKRKDLRFLEGEVPSPINPPSGCPFHPRCEFATEECKTHAPATHDLGEGRQVKCHLYNDRFTGEGEEMDVQM